MSNFVMKSNFKDSWLHGNSTEDSPWWCEVLFRILDLINTLGQCCVWYFCFIVYIENKIIWYWWNFCHCDKIFLPRDISIPVNRKLQPAMLKNKLKEKFQAYDIKIPLSWVYVYAYRVQRIQKMLPTRLLKFSIFNIDYMEYVRKSYLNPFPC